VPQVNVSSTSNALELRSNGLGRCLSRVLISVIHQWSGWTAWTPGPTTAQVSDLQPSLWTRRSGLLIRGFRVRVPGGALKLSPRHAG